MRTEPRRESFEVVLEACAFRRQRIVGKGPVPVRLAISAGQLSACRSFPRVPYLPSARRPLTESTRYDMRVDLWMFQTQRNGKGVRIQLVASPLFGQRLPDKKSRSHVSRHCLSVLHSILPPAVF